MSAASSDSPVGATFLNHTHCTRGLGTNRIDMQTARPIASIGWPSRSRIAVAMNLPCNGPFKNPMRKYQVFDGGSGTWLTSQMQ